MAACCCTACVAPIGRPIGTHPFGHGRELYFWSFVVALLVFALGAGVSFYEGIVHILDPEPIENVMVTYVVLGLSIVFEGSSWVIALREFSASKGNLGWIEAVTKSKDPSVFTVLFEGFCGPSRPGHRGRRHLCRPSFANTGARWCRLNRHRHRACHDGNLPRPRKARAC